MSNVIKQRSEAKAHLIELQNRKKALQLETHIRDARKNFENFVRFCWQGPEKFIEGWFIDRICDEFDEAVDRYERGESTYLMLALPFRHGKTSLAKLFTAYFLGRCASRSPSVMLTGYGAALVEDSSQDVRRIISCMRYGRVFPHVRLDPSAGSVGNWKILGSTGRVVATGLEGALNGRGYSLGLVDDPFKRRQDAESKTERQKIWTAFSNDFLTRRLTPSITILVGTPYHVADVRGMILEKMEKEKDFPRFKDIRFPAENPDGSWLWPEGKGEGWYREQKATLTAYEYASNMLCDPRVRTGGMFNTERLKRISTMDVVASDVMAAALYWDKAATALGGSYTAGTLMLKMRNKSYVVYDLIRGQWDSAERERRMRQACDAARDIFPMVEIGLEQEPGSSGVDSKILTIANLAGHKVIVDKVSKGKEFRADPWSTQVNGGNVSLVNAGWNDEYVDEHGSFPSGKYKDIVDSSSGAFGMLLHSGTGISGMVLTTRSTF